MRSNLLGETFKAWRGEGQIERWALALQRGASRFCYRAFPHLAQSALAMQAARFAPGGHSEFFSRDLREISPALNEDLLDLYGVSEQLLANTFSFHNVSKTLAPDFGWDGHPSAAWRRELHAFDYALPLAMTCRISQEDRYALHLRYLIAHWIAENPPGQTAGWELEALARRIRNWVLASDLAGAAWQGDREFQSVLEQSLAMQCAFLSRHANEAQSFAMQLHEARALLIASRFFGTSSAMELAEAGQALLSNVVHEFFHPETILPRPSDLFELVEACVEHLVFTPPASEPALQHSLELARKSLAVLEGALAPDGTLPLFGPSARSRADELSNVYALAAVILKEPRWKTLAGRFGIFPYLVLGEAGKFRFERMADEPWDSGTREVTECGVYRLGGGNRSALLINARAALSPDDHQDFLSYELYLQGNRVVVDSGSYSSEEDPESFASERAHNVLCIGGNWAPARRTILEAEYRTMARIQSVDRLGNTNSDPSPQEPPCQRVCLDDSNFGVPGVLHQRAFYCLDGAAWAVLDRLTGEGRLSLVNLIHFYPTFDLEILENHAIARSRALAATIIPLAIPNSSGSPKPTLEVSHGADSNFPGFYSPDFGLKFSCAVLRMISGEVSLPWVGGYLIVPGSTVSFRAGQVDARDGCVEFELSGKPYRLDLG